MDAMIIPVPRKTPKTAGWFPKKLDMILNSVPVRREYVTYERLEEEPEAPCSGFAITWVIVATTPSGSVASPVLVINGGVVTVTSLSVVSVIGAGVAKVDSGVSVIVESEL